MAWYGHSMTYSQTKEYYLLKFKLHISDGEIHKINNKIRNASSCQKFVSIYANAREMPNQKVIVKHVCSMWQFMFMVDYNKIAIASMELFHYWINNNKMFVSDEDLVDNLERIIAYCENLSLGRAQL
jgi:hypothetical protein